MRVLFYLPVVTPWWFENIVLHLLEKLAVDNEVHILAPIFGQGTGLSQGQYDLCAHLPDLKWHIVTDADHCSMRTKAIRQDQIVEFVEKLDPDFVLCRSADLETTALFPGIVRHITEGGADPLPLSPCTIHLAEFPFDHGLLPDLSDIEQSRLDTLMEPHWQWLEEQTRALPTELSDLREWAQLPSDRPTLFMPLEYEHAENFYLQHRVGSIPNAKLVEDIIAQLDGRAYLVLVNHPLNDLYVDNKALKDVLEGAPNAVHLLSSKTPSGRRTTPLIMQAVDGVLLGDSKCYSLAAFCGTPIVRHSRFQTGDWLMSSSNLGKFLDAICEGRATRPDAQWVRPWFAYHVANCLLSPSHHSLTGEAILERMSKPFDPDRWESNFRVFASSWTHGAEMAA